MHYLDVKRLLAVATKLADTKVPFDRFVSEVNKSKKGLDTSIVDTKKVMNMLDRSGYTQPATKLQEVLKSLKKLEDLLTTLMRMYSSGRLSYGPRAKGMSKV